MTVSTVHVIKTANESRGYPGAVLAADSELSIPLAAATSYWIEMGIMGWVYAYSGARHYTALKYSGTLNNAHVELVNNEMPITLVDAYRDRGGTNITYKRSQAAMEQETYLFNDFTTSTTARTMRLVSGRITTTTAGDLALWWRHYSTSYSPSSVVYAGSFLYVTPLNVCGI